MLAELQLAIWRWNMQRSIRKHGWTVAAIGHYERPPFWTYTTGFWECLGSPEIIFFDVPPADANRIAWEAHEQIAAGELVLTDGKLWIDEAPGRCMWRKVHPTQLDSDDGWMAFAHWYRWKKTGSRGLEAFQLVLSDAAGFFPWEEGYAEVSRPFQPELYLPWSPLTSLRRRTDLADA